MTGTRHTTSGISNNTSNPRRESVSHKDPDVVLIGNLGRKEDNNNMLIINI